MKPFRKAEVLSREEEDAIHRAMLRILSEVGVKVESNLVVERLLACGGEVADNGERVKFPPHFIERFVDESERYDWENVEPSVSGHTGVYHGWFLDPRTQRYERWTLQRVFDYTKVAHYLENVECSIGYAFPLSEVPIEASPILFHYLSFRQCGFSAHSLDNVRWCPYIEEMCQLVAEARGVKPQQVFRGTIHLISPLKMGREEAKVFLYFAERGYRVGIGSMTSAGGTAPVTLAGAISLHLAQALFINILNRAFFGQKTLFIGSSISPLDMRSGAYTYGRPEKALCIAAMAQMARRYGANFFGHGGHTTAKAPGPQAGYEKALTGLTSLIVCGRANISCGLLSLDEVFSPIQMIVDNDFVGALKRFARGFVLSDETLALELINEVGPGGTFIDTLHTATHFRSELWHPEVFTSETFDCWQATGGKSELTRACDIYRDITSRPDPEPVITEEVDHELRGIVSRLAPALDLQLRK